MLEERHESGTPAGLEASLGPSTSEIEIATSKDGKVVVVGSNSGTSHSNDYGGSFAASTTPAFSLGDPGVAVGASGRFYRSGIDVTSAGCANPVAVNSGDGVAFSFAGNAFLCAPTGIACFPDQPQIAADSMNSTATGDQIYVVTRRFDTPWYGPAVGCSMNTANSNTPVITCSSNNGATWGIQRAVGSGDFGRITVGSDGFVYVTFASGDDVFGHHLFLNKFTSCASGLNQVPGFPVTVAPLTGVDCPVSGLERCKSFAMSSPQPAVLTSFPNHIFIGYAERSSGTNDNIIVRHSSDGGLTWPDRFVANTTTQAAHRFMPWVCAGGNSAKVSWYDRRNSTAADDTLTDYFFNTVSISGPGTEMPVTTTPDSQKSGMNLVCPGCIRYGDYNGNACTQDRAYVGWSSATPPAGVTTAPAGIQVFVEGIPMGPPSVTSVTPNQTQCGAGTAITIAGGNFSAVSRVELDTPLLTAPLTFTVNSTSSITATVPANMPGGVYEVVVYTASGGSSALPLRLASTDQVSGLPIISGLTPNSGPVAGGTAVTVNGSCFEPGSRFFFGSSEGSVAQCPRTTQCTVYSPAATATGAFPVDVTAKAGGAASMTNPADLFTYTGPQITSVSPSSGPVTGGTRVFVWGRGFPNYNGTVFSLNPPLVTLTFGVMRTLPDCDSTLCTLYAPVAYNPGPVDVEIEAYGTYNILPQGFTYTAAPKLVRFDAGATYSGASEVAELDGNAAAGGASVTVASSDPSLVIPTSPINIPAGQLFVSAPMTINPSPTYQTVTLTANYNGTSLTTTVNVPPSPPLTLTMAGTALNLNQTADVTVAINSPAPLGGAVVNLSSSYPATISVPATVTIPEGSYSTTFSVTNRYTAGPNQVTISGTYNGASASDSIIVFTPPPPPPRCRPQKCPRLQYWNSDDCLCERIPRIR